MFQIRYPFIFDNDRSYLPIQSYLQTMQQPNTKINLLQQIDMAIKRKVHARQNTSREAKQQQKNNHRHSSEKNKSFFLPQYKNKSEHKIQSQKQKLSFQEDSDINSYLHTSNDLSKGRLSQRKFQNKKVNKLLSLINYVLSSAQKIIGHVNVSNFQAEFAVKLFISDKETLLKELEGFTSEDFGNRKASGKNASSNILQISALRADNSALKKQVLLFEAEIAKLKLQKSQLYNQLTSLRHMQTSAIFQHSVTFKQPLQFKQQAVVNPVQKESLIMEQKIKFQKIREAHLKQQLALKQTQTQKLGEVLKQFISESQLQSLLQNLDKSTKFNIMKVNQSLSLHNQNSKRKSELEHIISSLDKEYQQIITNIRRNVRHKNQIIKKIQTEISNHSSQNRRQKKQLQTSSIQNSQKDIQILEMVVHALQNKKSDPQNSYLQEKQHHLRAIEKLGIDNSLLLQQKNQLLNSLRSISKNRESVSQKYNELVLKMENTLSGLRQLCVLADVPFEQVQKSDISDLIVHLNSVVTRKHQQKRKQMQQIQELKSNILKEIKEVSEEKQENEKRYLQQLRQLRQQLQELETANRQLQDMRQEALTRKNDKVQYQKTIQLLKQQVLVKQDALKNQLNQLRQEYSKQLQNFNTKEQTIFQLTKTCEQLTKQNTNLKTIIQQLQRKTKSGVTKDVQPINQLHKLENTQILQSQKTNPNLQFNKDLKCVEKEEELLLEEEPKNNTDSVQETPLTFNHNKQFEDAQQNVQLLQDSNVKIMSEQMQKLKNQNFELKSAVENSMDQVASLEIHKENQNNEISRLLQIIERLQQERQRYVQKIASLQQQIIGNKNDKTSFSQMKSQISSEIQSLRQQFEKTKLDKQNEMVIAKSEFQIQNNLLKDKIKTLQNQIKQSKQDALLNANLHQLLTQANETNNQLKLKLQTIEFSQKQDQYQKKQLLESLKIYQKENQNLKSQVFSLKQINTEINNSLKYVKQRNQVITKLQEQTQKETILIKMKQQHTMNLIKIIIKKILNLNQLQQQDIDMLLEQAIRVLREWNINHPPDSATPKKIQNSKKITVEGDSGPKTNQVTKNTEDLLVLLKQQQNNPFSKPIIDFDREEDVQGKVLIFSQGQKLKQLSKISQKQQDFEQGSKYEMVDEYFPMNLNQFTGDQDTRQKLPTLEDKLQDLQGYVHQSALDEQYRIQSTKQLKLEDIRKSSVLDNSDIISNQNKSRFLNSPKKSTQTQKQQNQVQKQFYKQEQEEVISMNQDEQQEDKEV